MISISSRSEARGSHFETGKMKLYFMVALIIVAIHMGSAAWHEFECPKTKRVIWCPHEDPSHCLVYCSELSNKQDAPTPFGYYCYNTNPIMMCTSLDRDYCTRFCQGAARATSLPVAGKRNPSSAE